MPKKTAHNHHSVSEAERHGAEAIADQFGDTLTHPWEPGHFGADKHVDVTANGLAEAEEWELYYDNHVLPSLGYED